MNKRIKRKHVGKQNKDMMNSTLKYLKALDLTPFNVEYPKGYFIFENKNPYEMMHFQLKELPEFLFGVWYKEVNLYANPNDENVLGVVKLPIIFGERLCILDKFKPSRAEWSPLYNNYIEKGRGFELTEYYSTLRSLKEFVKAPWDFIAFETEEEYKKLLEEEKLKEKYTEEVLQVFCTKVEEKLKELDIPQCILVKDSYWSHMNLYAFFKNGTDNEIIENQLSLLGEFLKFDMDEVIREIAQSLNCSDFISLYNIAFNWHSDYYWLDSKEVLEKAKTMSFMELNKHFNDLNLKGSNFVRLIGK